MGKHAELGVEPGYFFSRSADGTWKVLKVDMSGTEVKVLARHVVRDSICDCPGYQHRRECRHVQMVYARPPGVDRATARQAAAEVVQGWEHLFNRILFEDYVFADKEETVVSGIKLRAWGKPIVLDGVEHTKVTGVHRKTHIELTVEQ